MWVRNVPGGGLEGGFGSGKGVMEVGSGVF